MAKKKSVTAKKKSVKTKTAKKVAPKLKTKAKRKTARKITRPKKTIFPALEIRDEIPGQIADEATGGVDAAPPGTITDI